MPHAPQLERLVFVSTQLCPHCARPASQPALQVPSEHKSPALHAVPQPPQLVGFELRSTQLPVQLIRPTAHWQALVAPFGVHSWPVWHLTPQPPQLLGSTDTFRHEPPQLIAPAWQAQAPATHVLPTAQEVPHLPQLALLVASDTHTPPHSSCPAAQTAPGGGEAELLLQASGSASAKRQARTKPWRRFIAHAGCHGTGVTHRAESTVRGQVMAFYMCAN